MISMSAECNIECRAAFDIGSGSTKLQVCECLLTQGGTGRGVSCLIVNELFEVEIPVQFGADLMKSETGMLSDDIQARGLQVFLELKAEAERCGATQLAVVATEVFRRAVNGNDYLNKLRAMGIKVELIPQSVEAELGYLSIDAITQMMSAKDGVARSVDCVWDSGGSLLILIQFMVF